MQILEDVKKDISEADKGTTAAGPPAAADTSTGGAGGKGGGAPVSQYVFRPRGEYYDVQFGKASALLAAKGRQGTYLLGPRYIAALLSKARLPLSVDDTLGDWAAVLEANENRGKYGGHHRRE